jgi:hypothetical protein
MNEQPLENQKNREDGGGEMQLANVAPVAKIMIRSIQEHRQFGARDAAELNRR